MEKYGHQRKQNTIIFPLELNPEPAIEKAVIKIDGDEVKPILANDKYYISFKSFNNTFNLAVDSPGYFTVEKVYYNIYNDSHPLSVELTPEEFRLHVKCTPRDVKVYVNGELKSDSTPVEISLDEFTLDDIIAVSLENDYYEKHISTISIESPTIFLEEELARKTREVGFKIIPSGDIYIDNERIGRSEGALLKLELEYGPHKLQVFNKEENYSREVNIKVNDKSQASYTYYIPKKKGTLQIVTIPPGANVFVDNELLGVSPQELLLSEGTHIIRIMLNNSVHEESVVIRAGETQKVIHNF